MKRAKFTTTLSESTIDKLCKMAPYIRRGGKCNDVIEKLVEKAWEEMKNEMDTKNRDNGQSS